MLRILLTRYWTSKVWRENNKILSAQTHYGDNDSEIIVTLKVDIHSFSIEQALVEKYISSGKVFLGSRNIEGAQGLVAYIGNGAQFKKVLAQNFENPITAEIFNDTVIALIQAETFVITERGFQSMQEYSRYWEQMYADTCKYYSNLDKIDLTWCEYVNHQQRGNILYNRFKNQQLLASGLDKYNICGTLLDQFHGMSTSLEVDKVNKKIINANANMFRVPDSICKDAMVEMEGLLDHDILSLDKKQIINLLGQKQGCVHLIDIVNESVQTITQYLSDSDKLSTY